MQEFMKLREQMAAEGKRFPSIKAFIALTGGEYEEREVQESNHRVYYELYAPNGIVLTYTHDLLTGEVSNLQLWHGEEVLYSEEE